MACFNIWSFVANIPLTETLNLCEQNLYRNQAQAGNRTKSSFHNFRSKKNICIWGYMLKKISVGRLDFFYFTFILFFFSIQMTYGILTQNIAEFQYTEVIN